MNVCCVDGCKVLSAPDSATTHTKTRPSHRFVFFFRFLSWFLFRGALVSVFAQPKTYNLVFFMCVFCFVSKRGKKNRKQLRTKSRFPLKRWLQNHRRTTESRIIAFDVVLFDLPGAPTEAEVACVRRQLPHNLFAPKPSTLIGEDFGTKTCGHDDEEGLTIVHDFLLPSHLPSLLLCVCVSNERGDLPAVYLPINLP